jgi:hypothetical protein
MKEPIDSIWIKVYLRIFEYAPEVLGEYYQDLSEEYYLDVFV